MVEQKPKHKIFIDVQHTFADGYTGTCRMQHNELFDGPIQKDKYKVVEYTETYEVLQPIKNINMKECTLVRNALCIAKDDNVKVIAESEYIGYDCLFFIKEDCIIPINETQSKEAKAGDIVIKFYPTAGIDDKYNLLVFSGESAKLLKERSDLIKSQVNKFDSTTSDCGTC